MATIQPSLYGAYEYGANPSGAPGNLYAASFVPQTYSLSLDETMTNTDADLVNATKALSESLTISEADAVTLSHAFSDTVTGSSALTKTLAKIFSEAAINPTDGALIITVKNLSDFLILKEWIAIRLTKSLVWINPETNANIVDSLYARNTSGPVIYGSSNALWGGLKPLASWTKGTRRQENWSITDGFKTIS